MNLSTREFAAARTQPAWNGTVRALAGSDLDAVAALEAACNAQPWSREALKSFLPSGLGAVAVAEGTVVGYILASAVRDEGEILILGVSPSARRQGIAAALLKDALARLRAAGVKAVFLEVRHGNKPALGLYRAFGFGEAGVRKGYYSDTGEDALLLHVFLKR